MYTTFDWFKQYGAEKRPLILVCIYLKSQFFDLFLFVNYLVAEIDSHLCRSYEFLLITEQKPLLRTYRILRIRILIMFIRLDIIYATNIIVIYYLKKPNRTLTTITFTKKGREYKLIWFDWELYSLLFVVLWDKTFVI